MGVKKDVTSVARLLVAILSSLLLPLITPSYYFPFNSEKRY